MRGKRNPFIVLEGIDASGKETISKMLAAYLRANLISFPAYASPTGKLIQEHLQGKWDTHYANRSIDRKDERNSDALVFQALQAANRLEHARYIQLSLSQGHALVADRYTVSGEAYGAADGLDPQYLKNLFSTLPQPDITFLLDIPVEESFRRRTNRGGDRYEEDREKLEDIRNRYLYLFQGRAHDDPWRWKVLDGTKTPEAILDQLLGYLRAV